MKTLFALFLVAHGLVHSLYLLPKPNDPKYPFHFGGSWFAELVGKISLPIGGFLVILTIASFTLVGTALLGAPGLESIIKQLVVTGAVSSLLVLVLFWRTWMVVGVIIDLVVLYGFLMLGWFA